MIINSRNNLSWECFEALNPNKREAFENLCYSLFRRTKVADKDVPHSNPNNPGVEVVPVLSKEETEMISFQAKYFDNNTRYEDIRESISKAIAYYEGSLDKIYLYCNKKIDASSQAYQRVEKMAKDSGITIVPITDYAIFDELLDFPHIAFQYFGIGGLRKEWFESNLKCALDSLGRRYNHRFNINTEAKRDLTLFLKNQESSDLLNSRKVETVEELKNLRGYAENNYRDIIDRLIKSINNVSDVQCGSITDALNWKDVIVSGNADVFAFLREREKYVAEALENFSLKAEERDRLRVESYVNRSISDAINTLQISDWDKKLITNRTVFIKGEMGIGKSQLLANSAKESLENGVLSLLILGQTLTTSEPVDIQIINGLTGLNRQVALDSLLGAINERADVESKKAVIYIDAINESRDREIWKDGLNKLISLIEPFQNILLVVSHRSGFEDLLYSDNTAAAVKEGRIAIIEHRGLINRNLDGVFDFLSHYGVPASPDFYLQHEMGNPLFLTWFCETFSGKEHTPISLIRAVLKQADEEASRSAGCKEPCALLEDLLAEFIETSSKEDVEEKTFLGFDTWGLYGLVNKLDYTRSLERSGVLATYPKNGKEYIYIGYNLLEDYLKAKWIMEEHKQKEKVKEYCVNTLFALDEQGEVANPGNSSVFAMIATIYADVFKEEYDDIFNYIKDGWEREQVLYEYLRSFTWRDPMCSLEQFEELIKKYNIDPYVVWPVMIECATKEEHKLNANGLTMMLKRYPLNKRDRLWTLYVNELTKTDRILSLAYYLESGHVLNGISDESAELLLTVFAWMLSSSNRKLRDRVSKAMIEILKRRLGLGTVILEKLKDVNDPYIIQRLYGILWGAVMKRTNAFDEEFEKLAVKVYDEVFSKEKVYPDILLRDYARLIIERFVYEYPNKKCGITIERTLPPYCSDPIPNVNVVDYSDEKYQKGGVWRLLSSMKFNLDVKGIGLYGDFGRYTFQYALGHFKNIDEGNIYYYALDYIFNHLGYQNELFEQYDTNMADFDRNARRGIERIGKKYEWITMYNVLARLSDTHNVRGNDWSTDEENVFIGPWNPFVRDFDPTLNLRAKVDKSDFPCFVDNVPSAECFIDIDSCDEKIEEWTREENDYFSKFPKRFIRKDTCGAEWVSLYLSQEVKRIVPRMEDFFLPTPRGEQHIWSISALRIADVDIDVSGDSLRNRGFANSEVGIGTTWLGCSLYNGEYAWSVGYKNVFSDEMRTSEDENGIRCAVINAKWEAEYDASNDEIPSLYIPAGEIIQTLNLYKKDIDGVYYYNDEVVALDTSVIGSADEELIMRKDMLDLFIEKKHAKVFWDLVGEKQFFLGNYGQNYKRREGYFIYSPDGIDGDIRIVETT